MNVSRWMKLLVCGLKSLFPRIFVTEKTKKTSISSKTTMSMSNIAMEKMPAVTTTAVDCHPDIGRHRDIDHVLPIHSPLADIAPAHIGK